MVEKNRDIIFTERYIRISGYFRDYFFVFDGGRILRSIMKEYSAYSVRRVKFYLFDRSEFRIVIRIIERVEFFINRKFFVSYYFIFFVFLGRRFSFIFVLRYRGFDRNFNYLFIDYDLVGLGIRIVSKYNDIDLLEILVGNS